jgi:DNA invertase Pin-like site-specific DNA recombinase
MICGYSRVSTAEQRAGLDAQTRDLQAADCERIWSEQTSSVGPRPQLDEVLRFVRNGDTLVITRPDRLARSTRQLLDIVEDLDRREVSLILLSMGGQKIDSRSPTGKMTLTILAAMAEFERGLMLERQREGIAAAAAAGKYKGRKPTARAKAGDIVRLAGEGATRAIIARTLKVSEASVYRVLASHGPVGPRARPTQRVP